MGRFWRILTICGAIALCSQGPAAGQGLENYIEEVARSVLRNRETKPNQSQKVATKKNYWVVVSSRPTSDEAIYIAQGLSKTLGPVFVVQSNNGRFAVVAGYLPDAKAKANLSALKAARLVPEDSFLAGGERFQQLVWSASPSGDVVEVVQSPQLRNTVMRLQTALKKLGLYVGIIDGSIGPATSTALTSYVANFGVLPSETLDMVSLQAIESAAADGFKSESERQIARQGGFPDAVTLAEAQRGGFDNS